MLATIDGKALTDCSDGEISAEARRLLLAAKPDEDMDRSDHPVVVLELEMWHRDRERAERHAAADRQAA